MSQRFVAGCVQASTPYSHDVVTGFVEELGQLDDSARNPHPRGYRHAGDRKDDRIPPASRGFGSPPRAGQDHGHRRLDGSEVGITVQQIRSSTEPSRSKP
jgi:hypothetical protein